MKRFLYLLALLISGSGMYAQKTDRLPNIVIIYIDDMGYGDISPYNKEITYTPSFAWLAQNGLMFTDFYVSQAVCSASRTSLLTGCYSNRLGIHGALFPDSKVGLNPDETTIADMLKAKGYATKAIGKWHLGYQPQFLPTRQGFDEYYGIPYSNDMWYKNSSGRKFPPLPLIENETTIDTISEQSWFTQRFTEKAVDFISAYKSKPFFLYLAHPMPHIPIYVSEKFKGKSGKGLYADVIMELDWSVGEIINTLKKYKLEKNTLLIVASDNGPWLPFGNHAGVTNGLRESKGTSWDGGVRVPCLMYWKGKLKKNVKVNMPLMMIDILPTIASLVNAPLPEKKIDGINIWSYIEKPNQVKDFDRPLFIYYNTNELQAMRWKNWKLYFPHTYNSMEGIMPGKEGKRVQAKAVKLEAMELYDLSKDEGEKINLTSQFPEIVNKMNAMADEIRKKIGDSLKNIKGTENREPGRVTD
ncbi:MAG TPA: sulfatase [Chitinophagaceae bacterium]|nr:sulfatase [Chitinophagaceae bacterium]